MQTGAATVENGMEIPQKIKNGPALWLSDSTSENLPEETQNTNLTEYILPYVHCSIIYNSEDLEVAQVPSSRWVDERAVVEYYSAIKKKK